jgi:phosphoribosylformimino-5-aminoimidazole carboxamide ribotide isomerase
MAQKFPQRLVVGIDARNGLVATHGWLQTSSLGALDLAQQVARLPIAAIVYTDIARDGMLSGPNFVAMSQMAAAVTVPVIASGGITTAGDIARLAELGLAGCIVGRALYEQRITLPAALAAAAGREY